MADEKFYEEERKHYRKVVIDLSVARTDERKDIAGDFILVESYDSTTPLYIKLNQKEAATIDLTKVRSISSPFSKLFLTNSAGSGTVTLLIGGEAQFRGEAARTVTVESGTISITDSSGTTIDPATKDNQVIELAKSGTAVVESVSRDSAGTTTIYTVPTGKTLYLTSAYLYMEQSTSETSTKLEVEIASGTWKRLIYIYGTKETYNNKNIVSLSFPIPIKVPAGCGIRLVVGSGNYYATAGITGIEM